MIKLICSKCASAWYTSNTSPNQKCSACGGLLIEDNFFDINGEEHKANIKNISASNIIQLKNYLGPNAL